MHCTLLIKNKRGMRMKWRLWRTMCYQRCESTADGSGLETECKGHRNRRETARREKRGKMKRERERRGKGFILVKCLGFFVCRMNRSMDR